MILKRIIQKIKSIYICFTKNILVFFGYKNDIKPEINSDRIYFEIDNKKDFDELRIKYDLPISSSDTHDFSKNRFCMLAENNEYGCYGWYTADSKKINFIEICSVFRIPDNCCVLFDFYTNPKKRRQGFYSDLLKNIINNNPNQLLIVFVMKNNIASLKGVQKAGFETIGEYNHKNFKNFYKKINSILK